MSDDLTPEVRAKVLEHFIFSAPPGESAEVIAGEAARSRTVVRGRLPLCDITDTRDMRQLGRARMAQISRHSSRRERSATP